MNNRPDYGPKGCCGDKIAGLVVLIANVVAIIGEVWQ